MTRVHRWSVRVLLALLLVFASRASAQCQAGWLDAPDIPGVGYGTNGLVRAVVSWTPSGATQPVLVAGGIFTTAGGASANNIAIWDGATWQPMGSGLTGGSTPGVWALAVYNNQLIAAGAFTSAGGVAANNIARWTGSSWQALGGGLTAAGLVNVRALCVYNGSLYASGEFGSAGGVTLTGMARWNGSSWSSAPAGPGPESSAYAMTVYNNELYAGGLGGFNGQTILYRFNGSAWFNTPGPIIGTLDVNDTFPSIRALTVWNNKIVVAGNFHDVGGFVNVGGIAAWDGGAWSTFSTGMDKIVYSLTTVGGTLYAGGAFTTASSVLSFRAARWNGSNWNGLDSSMSGSGALSVLAECEFKGELVAGGNFTTITGLHNVATVNNLGRYNPTTQQWSSAHTAAPIRVFSGAVTAAGDFTVNTSSGQARRVVGWSGSELGAFIDLGGFTGPNGPIYAIGSLSTNPFTPAFTVLGGSFSSNAGTTANNICTYRFGVWGTLGSGFNGAVRALATFNGSLYAAGDFTASGAVPCNHIAKYVSGAWQDVGGGFNGSVNALYVFSGNLFAGGTFTTAGGNAVNYLAAYNGTAWSGTGDGLLSNGAGSGVYSFTSYSLSNNVNSPFLAIGGKFVTSFNSIQNLANRGSLTFPLGGYGGVINDTVRALTMYQGNLIAGGDFTSTPGGAMSHIARFVFGAGGGWQAMGSGVDAPVYALISAWHSELHVGGAFGEAGGVPAESWGRWNTTGAPAIYTDPSSQFTDSNCHATFTVTPLASYTNLSYQWFKNGVQLNNGATATGSIVAGATTATLSLSNLDHPDQGAYTCAVSNSCGTTLSNAANLTVICCGHSDFNHDGDLGTDADIAAFFDCLAGNCCATCGSVDFNGDGDLGTDADIAAFFRILGGGGC